MKKNADETKSEAVPSEKGAAGAKVRKILSIVLDVVLYLFLAFSLFVLVISLVSKKNDGAANIFGYEMRIVVSSSMEKSENSKPVDKYEIKDIKLRSMVFVERVPEEKEKAQKWYSDLKEGDVLTFVYVINLSQETITHRITKITATETGYIIDLQGDNRTEGATVSTQTIYTSEDDYPNQNAHYNYVIGKVVGQSAFLGYVVYGISQPVGMALIIIVPCCIIIIWQVVRVVTALGEERRKKTALKIEQAERLAAAESEEREKQARELEELRQRLAELEKPKSDKDGDDGGVG